MIDDSRIKTIAEHYGFDRQCDKLIEEMSELLVAITHMKKKDENCADHYSNFIEELGDVMIIASQLQCLLPPPDRITLSESISFKLNREIERMENNRN